VAANWSVFIAYGHWLLPEANRVVFLLRRAAYDLQQNVELLSHNEVLNQVAGGCRCVMVVSMDDARVIIRWARTDYTDDV
jgi:hypothetical protein